MRPKQLAMSILVLASGCWTAVLLWGIPGMLRQRHDKRAQSGIAEDAHPHWTDLIPSVGVVAGIVVAQWLVPKILDPFARALIPKKPRWSNALWGMRIERCCSSIFRCCYFLAMTAWGYSALSVEPWLPWPLGGSGSTSDCWTEGYPHQRLSRDVMTYYVISVGYGCSEVLLLLLEMQRRPDFQEMLLHHLVTLFCLVFSYVVNYVRIGSLVLLLHGMTDVVIYFSKAVVDTTLTSISKLSYVILLISYGWLRVYVFPMYVMHSAWVESRQSVAMSDLYGWRFFNFMLCILYMLHVYWFGLIMKIGVHLIRTGQPSDMQSNLSGIDLKDKKAS